MKTLHYLCFALLLVLTACSEESNVPPAVNTATTTKPEVTKPTVTTSKNTWKQAQQARMQAKEKYIGEHQIAYEWFANFAFGETDGTPYFLMKLLPIVAPEIWGSEENFLDVVGLFKDERIATYPMARGVGISGLARDDLNGNIDYASFTCGACHIGRVRKDDGSYYYIDGGANTEFNVVAFRVKVYQTVQKVYGDVTDQSERDAKAIQVFLDALDSVHSQDPNFFYNNFAFANRKFDTAYEQKQVELFKQQAEDVIPTFMARATLEFEAYSALVAQNYKGYEDQMVAGLGGMADATGISSGNAWILAKLGGHPNPNAFLPTSPGLTDFMAPWEQSKRKVRWNADQTELIDGGGQWNGNIPISMFRNLAAQATLGLTNNDIRVSVFAEELLDGLPASVYPFDVDLALANKGKPLFQDNCVDCHRPHNGTVYKNLGTDFARSFVIRNEDTVAGARAGLSSLCSPETEVDLPGQGKVKPCAEYEGVSLVGKSQFVMTDAALQRGYNALPLGGIWAQAPYLHTGGVPTLYHLLVPGERPDSFVKGRIDYDQKHVGFAWQQPASDNPNAGEGYQFDTKAFPSVSNVGHDTDITEAGKTYKLDWSDDKEAVMAIIEYMKTL